MSIPIGSPISPGGPRLPADAKLRQTPGAARGAGRLGTGTRTEAEPQRVLGTAGSGGRPKRPKEYGIYNIWINIGDMVIQKLWHHIWINNGDDNIYPGHSSYLSHIYPIFSMFNLIYGIKQCQKHYIITIFIGGMVTIPKWVV